MNHDEGDTTDGPALAGELLETDGATALDSAPAITREQRRSRRKRDVRARTISVT